MQSTTIKYNLSFNGNPKLKLIQVSTQKSKMNNIDLKKMRLSKERNAFMWFDLITKHCI